MASSQATTKIDSRQSTDHLDACKRQQRSRDAYPALQRQRPGRGDVFRVVFSKAGELSLQTDKPWGGVIALCRPGVKILIQPLHSTMQPHVLCIVQGNIADKEASHYVRRTNAYGNVQWRNSRPDARPDHLSASGGSAFLLIARFTVRRERGVAKLRANFRRTQKRAHLSVSPSRPPSRADFVW